jgi:hypothetical protein
LELDHRVKLNMIKENANDNIKLDLARVGRKKDLDLYYFGPDGNRMYNIKGNEELDREEVRLKLMKDDTLKDIIMKQK